MKALYIFLGPPGSGKGTQAQLLQESHNVTILSTGHLIREEIKRQTRLGKQVESIVHDGQLVPDDYLMSIIEPLLSDLEPSESASIFDGFPRTHNQAVQFDALLDRNDRRIDQVFYFDATLPTILKRIGGRRVCSYCNKTYHIDYFPPKIAMVCDTCQSKLIQRNDDFPAVVKRRYEAYCSETAILRDYYHAICTVIDTAQSLQAIAQELKKHI